MKTVIYSKKNPTSVDKVEAWRTKHPKFTFVELKDKEGMESAQSAIDAGTAIFLDEPKKKEEVAEKATTTKKTTTKKEKVVKTKSISELVLGVMKKKSMTSEQVVDALPKSNSGSVKGAISRMVKTEKLVKTVKGKKTTYKVK